MIAVPCVSSAHMYTAAVAAKPLEADPDVGLEVLDQVPDVDWPLAYGNALVTRIRRMVVEARERDRKTRHSRT